jgi:hypothetical protein
MVILGKMKWPRDMVMPAAVPINVVQTNFNLLTN